MVRPASINVAGVRGVGAGHGKACQYQCGGG